MIVTQDKQEIEKSLDEASEVGLFRAGEARPPIKLKADAPKVVIAIPIGDKDDPDLYVCPKCNERQFAKVTCCSCKEVFDNRLKLRRAGLVSAEFAINITQQVMPLLCSVQFMIRKSVLSAQARNEMTYEAIKRGAKYIFYWDDDTLIPPKTIYELHNMMERTPDAAVISGVYTTREECPEPLYYKDHGEGAYWNFINKPGVLEPIFGAGAGCMMARVEALVEIEKEIGGPWWADEHTADSDKKSMWGHDIRFCRRVHEMREQGLGSQPWQVYGAGWIQCGHIDVNTQTIHYLPSDTPALKNNDLNSASYWDYIWGSEGHGTGRQYPELYSAICDMVPEDSKVLDVGCGIGILMDMLTKKNRARCFGIDISPKAIEMLQSRWLEGVAGDIGEMNLKVPKETLVVSTETLEHLADEKLDHFLTQAAKHTSRLIASTPDGKLVGTPEGEHVQEFTRNSLRKKLKAYYKNVKIKKIGHLLLADCDNAKKKKPKRKGKKS